MAKNYVGEGEVLDIVNGTGSTIASGSVVLISKRIVIPTGDIAAGDSGAASAEGIFAVAKNPTDVVAQGDLLYWDNTNKRLTTTVSTNTYAGYAAKAAANGVTTVEININK